MTTQIEYAIVAGLGVGGMYALIALGYTVVLAASGVFNFGQGSIVMGGALVMFGLATVAHWPIVAAFALVIAGGAIVGMLSNLIAVLPVSNRRGIASLTEGTLVTTFGLGLVMNTLAAIFFGNEIHPANSYVTHTPLTVFGVKVQPIYLVMMGVTIVVALFLEWVLRRTNIGLLLRVTVEDVEGARLGGVPVGKVVLCAFGVGGALAALAGALLVPVTFASVNIAGSLVLLGFAGMAIGGYGSFVGALIGGVLVGLISQLVPVWLDPAYSSLIVYGVMVVILIIRPRGLFGSAGHFGSAGLREV